MERLGVSFSCEWSPHPDRRKGNERSGAEDLCPRKRKSLMRSNFMLMLALSQLSGSSAIAQIGRCHSNGLDSKIWIFNSEIGGLVEYPNFRTPGGNVEGDAFWKVIPSE